MNYTEFGEYFKILRIKHHEVLADAKKFLSVSAAFISSVECGKRPVPSEWFEKISSHYSLNDKEKHELKEAIEKSSKVLKINIENVNSTQKNVAIQFQRSFDNLDEDTAQQIIDILKRNT